MGSSAPAQQTSGSAPIVTLVAAAGTGHVPTLYTRLGNWFAWLDLAALAGLLAALFAPLKRPARP